MLRGDKQSSLAGQPHSFLEERETAKGGEAQREEGRVTEVRSPAVTGDMIHLWPHLFDEGEEGLNRFKRAEGDESQNPSDSLLPSPARYCCMARALEDRGLELTFIIL